MTLCWDILQDIQNLFSILKGVSAFKRGVHRRSRKTKEKKRRWKCLKITDQLKQQSGSSQSFNKGRQSIKLLLSLYKSIASGHEVFLLMSMIYQNWISLNISAVKNPYNCEDIINFIKAISGVPFICNSW